MERGASYSLHEDGEPPAKPIESLLQGGDTSSSGYQPPSVPLHRGVAVPAARTGRIIDRADTLFQRSKGRWNIRRHKVESYWKLYLQDPFHSVVNMRLSKVLGTLVFLYLSTLLFFGFLYTTVPDHCKTAIFSLYDGFSFSVSVLFTIGFGTNGGDVFFNRCGWMQTVITSESLVGMLLEAISIGIIFQRFSRAQARANTIVLSTNAVVRRIRGELYFMFQACEMRKHQLVEAHVRMYAIRHDVEFGTHYYFQSHPMRIQHPDDDLGGMLLLALPSVVVHRMDAWSPLCRPKSRAACALHHHPAKGYLFPEVISRQADLDSGDRDGLVPLPAEDKPKLCTPCTCVSAPVMNDPASHEAAVADIKDFWKDSQVEVVVLVEGIDAVTSSTIQVRHSYKAEEILFDRRFENCVDVDPVTGGAVVDFRRFHETHPVDPESTKVAGGFY
ncbi:hypothetical protein PybrP1_005619 [[Pythium] brassicae (nom. inval.)]|nr:hypothetical protein PybrP1_005619 [[Pythium] brassicae (nom. inval.)]